MRLYIFSVYTLYRMMLKKNRILWLIMGSLSIIIFALLFFTGYFAHDYYEGEQGSFITIECTKNADLQEKESLLRRLKEDKRGLHRLALYSENNENIVGEYNTDWNNGNIAVIGKSYSFEEKKPYVILTVENVDFVNDGESPIGKKIIYENDKFEVKEVVEYTEDSEGYCVPPFYFLKNYDISEIKCSFDNYMSAKEIRELKKDLKKSAVIQKIEIHNLESWFFTGDFWGVFYQLILIFGIIMLNVFFLETHWIFQFNKNYAIYKVCGASQHTIRNIVVIQTAVLSMISIGIGNVIFWITRHITKTLPLVSQNHLEIYGQVSVCIFLLLLYFSYAVANKVVKTNIVYRVRE